MWHSKVMGLLQALNFADYKLNFTHRIRKLCGKRRKCWLPAFSPFHTVFLKFLRGHNYLVKC